MSNEGRYPGREELLTLVAWVDWLASLSRSDREKVAKLICREMVRPYLGVPGWLSEPWYEDVLPAKREPPFD